MKGGYTIIMPAKKGWNMTTCSLTHHTYLPLSIPAMLNPAD